MNGDREESNAGFTRRGYLGILGSASVVAVGATQVVSADEQGYGTAEYGVGPYGGSETQDGDGSEEEEEVDEEEHEEETDEEEETERDAVPEITELTGSDVSNPSNPHVDAEINWEASIDDSELYAARLTLSDPDGELKSWKYDLSGQTAGETEVKRIPHGSREDTEYTVELIVYSYYGRTDKQTVTFRSQ